MADYVVKSLPVEVLGQVSLIAVFVRCSCGNSARAQAKNLVMYDRSIITDNQVMIRILSFWRGRRRLDRSMTKQAEFRRAEEYAR